MRREIQYLDRLRFVQMNDSVKMSSTFCEHCMEVKIIEQQHKGPSKVLWFGFSFSFFLNYYLAG